MERSNTLLCLEGSHLITNALIKGNLYVNINAEINQVRINKSAKNISEIDIRAYYCFINGCII